MANDLTYDDRELQAIFRELDPRKRKQLFRRAFQKTGSMVMKETRRNLKASGLRNAAKMQRGVRVVIFRRDAGFRVTVAGRASTTKNPKGEKSMYLNSRGKKKPVLQWAEPGTARRRTRGPYRKRTLLRRMMRGRRRGGKTGLNRGRMPSYGFMEKTRSQVEGKVGGALQQEIKLAIEHIAKKHGIR